MVTNEAAPIPLTVILRSYNDAHLLPETIRRLRAQEGVSLHIIAFESASTDNSLAVLQEHAIDVIHEMEPGSYRSARVLNQGAAEATTELIAYVNSDALIEGTHVLRTLADTILAHDKCAASFAAQVVRPDASVMTQLDYFIAFENRDQLKSEADWLSMVCSMVRKSAWDELHFDEQLTFAEDAVWSHAMLKQGWSIRYCADCKVEHSHDYTASQRYRRNFGDASALAMIRDEPPARTAVGGLFKPLVKRILKDSWNLTRMGVPWAAILVPWHRYWQL